MIRKKEIFSWFSIWALVWVLFSCGSRQEEGAAEQSSTLDRQEGAAEQQTTKVNKDTLILELTAEILTALKEKDYHQLAEFFHPIQGVRFSPYGYVDTLNHLSFTASTFRQVLKEDRELLWGSYDGTGEDIRLSPTDYFEKFVYDVDFLHAEEITVNRFLGKGNSLNNLETIYPGSDFSESHFSGFEEKYGGMDWRSLRLVFRPHEGKMYLVAVIHDQWTI